MIDDKFRSRARRLVLRGLSIPVYRDLIRSGDAELLASFECLSIRNLREANRVHADVRQAVRRARP